MRKPNIPYRGKLLYATVLRLVVDGVSTAFDIVQATGIESVNVRKILRGLHAHGLIHVAQWVHVGTASMPVRSFAYGPGVDAAPPVSRRTGLALSPVTTSVKPMRRRSEMISFAALVAELRAGPSTAHMLAETTGISDSYVYPLLRHMHALRLIRVASWALPLYGGAAVRMYGFAIDRSDAKRPARMAPEAKSLRKAEGTAARNQMLAFTHALAGSANAARFPIAA